jgi:hypothetical protein
VFPFLPLFPRKSLFLYAPANLRIPSPPSRPHVPFPFLSILNRQALTSTNPIGALTSSATPLEAASAEALELSVSILREREREREREEAVLDKNMK